MEVGHSYWPVGAHLHSPYPLALGPYTSMFRWFKCSLFLYDSLCVFAYLWEKSIPPSNPSKSLVHSPNQLFLFSTFEIFLVDCFICTPQLCPLFPPVLHGKQISSLQFLPITDMHLQSNILVNHPCTLSRTGAVWQMSLSYSGETGPI